MLKPGFLSALPALWLFAASAHAEPSPAPSDAFRGRNPANARPAGSDGARRVLPGESSELIERLRNRVKLPIDGPRAQGRKARARERAFDQALKDPEANPDDLRAKLQELEEHRPEMRRERRRTAFARWGVTATDPRAKPELELHARRMARIRRMQFLAATERSGEKRSALLERLSRLRDLERGRHERAMQALAAGSDPSDVAITSPSARPIMPSASALRGRFGGVPKVVASGTAKEAAK